jgi:ribosome-binding protein aMBF1 (putative translation factor)
LVEVPRPPAPVQEPPDKAALIQADISRERAELAFRIGTLRQARAMNWRQLAKKAEIHTKQVQGIESGQRDPSFSTLLKLARALELHSLDELVVELPLTASDSTGKTTPEASTNTGLG